MDVARDGPADAGPADPVQRLPRRRGLLRQRRAGGRAARCGLARAGPRPGRRRAVRPRAQPVRFLAHPPHDARERGPEPQLPRLLQAAAEEPGLPRAAPAAVARPVAAFAGERSPTAALGGRGTAPPPTRPPSAAASTTSRTACTSAARGRPGATARCARCCARTGARLRRIAWIDLHTGLGPSGLGERIYAGPDDAQEVARARSWWDGGGRTPVTSIYDGSSTSSMLTGMMWSCVPDECPQTPSTPASPWSTAPSRCCRCCRRCAPSTGWTSTPRRRPSWPRDQAADAGGLLHRHARMEAAHLDQAREAMVQAVEGLGR